MGRKRDAACHCREKIGVAKAQLEQLRIIYNSDSTILRYVSIGVLCFLVQLMDSPALLSLPKLETCIFQLKFQLEMSYTLMSKTLISSKSRSLDQGSGPVEKKPTLSCK